MRVAFITDQQLFDVGGTLQSPLASVRRELLLPAKVLADRGLRTDVISLPMWPREHLLKLLDKADRIVFGKLLPKRYEEGAQRFSAEAGAYRQLLAALPRSKWIAFCLSDDHFELPAFASFYAEAPASLWVCSSEPLQAKAQSVARCPVLVYPEPAELPPGEARVPRRGLRERAGIWLARRTRVGLDPWRLRLLWFGHPSNAGSMQSVLPELRAFARDVPTALQCVTQPGSELDGEVTAPAVAATAALRVTVVPWSLGYMSDAFEDCDAVLLPQRSDDPQKRAKSNNRLIDTLQAGRFAIAQPIPSYEKLRDYAWVGESIAEGLRWLLRHPGQALQRVLAGQEFVARQHSLDALADFWLAALKK